MSVTAELADGRRLEFPDGTDPAVVQRTVKSMLAGGTTPAESPAPPTAEKETSWLQDAGNLAAGAVRGAGSIGATLLAPADMINQKLRGEDFWSLKDNRERRKAMDEGLGLMGADTESGLYKTGKVGAEIAGTAGAGGVLGKLLTAASSSPKALALADALSSYGIGQSAKGIGYLPRVGAGAASGGTAAALVDPDEVGMGAAVGGAIPAVAPVARFLGNTVASATGPLRESWRTGQGRKFVQEMLGSDDSVQKVIQAIAKGQGAGRTTVADDIAAANLGQSQKFGSPLVAIEDRLATQPGGLSDTAKSVLARQAATQRMALSEAAGAPSQEMAILARGGTKGTLSTNVGPKLEQELAAANIAGKALPRLQGDADRFAGAAADKVQDVRRFTAAGERADDLAQNFQARGSMPQPARGYNPVGKRGEGGFGDIPKQPLIGQPRIPGRYSYADALAKRAERVAQKSADDSLIFGEQARHSQMMADSLAKHGFKPLSGNALLSKINSEIMKPGTGDIKLNERVLNMVAARVKNAADKQGGRLDAKSLQAIRQTEIDDVVDRALTGNPNVSKERMAEVVGSLKSSIDDAIEAAGGTGWKPAMKEWSQGMTDISRQKMNAVALGLFDKDKAKLMSLAEGNEPDLVKKVFPVGAPVLGFQMGGKDAAIKKVAKELSRDAERATLGQSVDTKHLFEIADKGKGTISFPTLLSRPAMLVNWIMKQVGHGADERITQDMGKLMLSDPAAFSAKYLKDIPPSSRKQAFDVLMKHYGTPTVGAAAPVIAAQQRR